MEETKLPRESMREGMIAVFWLFVWLLVWLVVSGEGSVFAQTGRLLELLTTQTSVSEYLIMEFRANVSEVGKGHFARQTRQASTRARDVAVNLYPNFPLWRNKFG